MFWVPILLVAIFAVRIIGTFLSEYGMAMIARNVIRDLRALVFNKIIVCRHPIMMSPHPVQSCRKWCMTLSNWRRRLPV